MAIASALLVAVAIVTGPAVAQQMADSGAALFTLKPLGHNVFAAIPNPGSGAGGNSGFIIGDDGVAVVDTFQTVAAARQLLDAIRKQTQLPVKFVVNTHYHLDHVAGNGVFAAAGAAIFAQANVRDWIHSENPKFFGAAITPAQKTMVAELFAPEVVYEKGIDLYLGSRRIEVRVFPGHTGGDSVVFVPDAQVVFTGDLFWNHMLPNLIDASTAPMLDTLNSLTGELGSSAFVPGHGEVGTARTYGIPGIHHELARADHTGSDRGKIRRRPGGRGIAAVKSEVRPVGNLRPFRQTRHSGYRGRARWNQENSAPGRRKIAASRACAAAAVVRDQA